jgi:rare lipoprotein A
MSLGTKASRHAFRFQQDRTVPARDGPSTEENKLRHFRFSQRRPLRDALIAGAIAATAVGGSTRLAAAHPNVASTNGVRHIVSKEIPAADDRVRRRSIRLKLFAPPQQRPANSHRSPAGEIASGESETSGIASIYSDRETASGEIMDAGRMTAAHRTLPFGTQVTVLNRSNGRSAVVRINDRGPFVSGRVIDLSPAAGRALDIDGLAPVSLILGDVDASHESKQSSAQEGAQKGQ